MQNYNELGTQPEAASFFFRIPEEEGEKSASSHFFTVSLGFALVKHSENDKDWWEVLIGVADKAEDAWVILVQLKEKHHVTKNMTVL